MKASTSLCVTKRLLFLLLVLLVIVDLCSARGGRGGGGGRSGGFGRSGGGFRGSSAARGGTSTGRGTASRGSSSGSRGNWGGGSRVGSGSSHVGTGGIYSGGGARIGHADDRRKATSWGSGGTPKYTKGSGIGSMVRSNQFKNAIVGAAAGYLTYQAGKAIIRSAVAPMMWNNRPYYWGPSYYRSPSAHHTMCRMPIDGTDQQLGNIYFPDNSRPREIVWSCDRYQSCCGVDCCASGGGYFGGYRGVSLGTMIVLFLLVGCGTYLIYKFCTNTMRCGRQSKYTPGTEQPPPYHDSSRPYAM